MSTTTYVSVDIETNGPCPGKHSMLSVGAQAKFPDGSFQVFSANLEPLPDAIEDPDTMDWWKTQPEAWAACQAHPRPASEAIPEFVAWVDALPGKVVFVGYPAGFDFTFVYYYCHVFAGRSPFSFAALDIKSYVAGMLGTEYRNTVKRNMPKAWFPKVAHNHVAVDDAVEQGELFANILAANTRRLQAPTITTEDSE